MGERTRRVEGPLALGPCLDYKPTDGCAPWQARQGNPLEVIVAPLRGHAGDVVTWYDGQGGATPICSNRPSS